jgi:hypothetical protein
MYSEEYLTEYAHILVNTRDPQLLLLAKSSSYSHLILMETALTDYQNPMRFKISQHGPLMDDK